MIPGFGRVVMPACIVFFYKVGEMEGRSGLLPAALSFFAWCGTSFLLGSSCLPAACRRLVIVLFNDQAPFMEDSARAGKRQPVASSIARQPNAAPMLARELHRGGPGLGDVVDHFLGHELVVPPERILHTISELIVYLRVSDVCFFAQLARCRFLFALAFFHVALGKIPMPAEVLEQQIGLSLGNIPVDDESDRLLHDAGSFSRKTIPR